MNMLRTMMVTKRGRNDVFIAAVYFFAAQKQEQNV